MPVSGGTRWILRIGSAITLAFLYLPLVVIAIYAFNPTRSQAWPTDGFSTKWFSEAFHNPGARDALWTSVQVGFAAMVIALILGTLAAYALARYDFFGKESISFLVILPLYAGLERINDSLLDASGDLGARPWRTFRSVVVPLALPAIVAGSIFTFSLTLGDYITPQLVSNTQFIGNVVYANVGIANNLPLAAAFATVPVVIMLAYLGLARRLGAFEAL